MITRGICRPSLGGRTRIEAKRGRPFFANGTKPHVTWGMSNTINDKTAIHLNATITALTRRTVVQAKCCSRTENSEKNNAALAKQKAVLLKTVPNIFDD